MVARPTLLFGDLEPRIVSARARRRQSRTVIVVTILALVRTPTPPASVGPQVLGRFHSAPSMGFGTAGRKEVRKVWISQEHQKIDMHGFDSPGPGAPYVMKSTMGKQESSAMASPPAWVIGSAARAKDEPGRFSPGPAATFFATGCWTATRFTKATRRHPGLWCVDARST